ncbi:MAG TPA: mannosyltransferase family protein [Rubrobacter sp.]|nr:mannosyltransferase family protein [Rubrobacter sp.]
MGYEKANRKSTGAVSFVLLVYAASRLFYLLAGALLARIVPVSRFQSITSDVPFGTMNLWSHWDGEHYAALAAGGYLQPPDNVSPAFFPLYPLLMRSFAEVFGGPLSPGALSLWGMLLSLAALPFALFFVYRIAEDGWGEGVARGTVLVLAFFPTTFFLNAAYTESLFLALSAGSLWAARVRKDLLLACLLAGLATATRNVGVFLLAPLFLEWLRDARHYRWRGVYLVLAPSGLVVYAGYLWWRFGDPLLFYTDQQKWGRQAAGPLATAGRTWEAAVEGAVRLLDPRIWSDPSLGNLANHLEGANSFYNLVFFVFAVVVLVAGLRDLPSDLSVYAFLLVAPATLFGTPESPLMGTPRYLLVAFPLFIVLGLLSRNRLLFGGWLVLSAAASLVLCALFVSWRFVA